MSSPAARRASETVQRAIDSALVMLLDHLTSADTPARVSLFVGPDHRAVRLAEATRERGCPTPAKALETADWPLEMNSERVGFVRFAVSAAARAGAYTTTAAEITARLARDEPRVVSLVTSLTHLGTLAEYLRGADEVRRADFS